MKVPYTYMWSQELVPKLKDWADEIDVSGFVFVELAAQFEPPKDLVDFFPELFRTQGHLHSGRLQWVPVLVPSETDHTWRADMANL